MIGSTKQVKQNTTRDVTTSSVLKQLSETWVRPLGLTRLRYECNILNKIILINCFGCDL